ncbi:hypothetical protein [Tessaracoccus antarcticus]|uniref:Uncharacterized protein n=1 Tax=Tessaracoccus antarcticus TaxID=2479848 RepID=A0A3M0G8Q0_9ACTN|nr:hypothetical protein [Tessaracoccus antarcticus]RMB61410.1 hypothetical protein EAX62_01775 [Tessaracoccus antarcticus]
MADADDDDLLAPDPALASDSEPEDIDAAVDDGGVSDSQAIVRVWVEDGRLTKVRVSPLWHTKLGRRALDDCFTQALTLANVRVAEVKAHEPRTFDNVDFSQMPRFGPHAFAAFQAAFDDVEQRWGDALERDAQRSPTSRPVISGRHKGVTVSLNGIGAAQRVTFDPTWLDTAQAGAICTHVMRAAENAYARFIPVEDDRRELDDIETEHEFLLTAFQEMLNPKERS